MQEPTDLLTSLKDFASSPRYGSAAVACGRAAAEIERLRDAKRRALAIADERGKEAAALRAALEAINGEIVLTGQLKDIVDAALELNGSTE